jgi:integrase
VCPTPNNKGVRSRGIGRPPWECLQLGRPQAAARRSAIRFDVAESLSEISGRLHTGPTKTGARRTVTIPRFLSEMLGEHIGAYSSEYVFTSAEGKPLRRNLYRRHFKPAVPRAGLEPLRFHDVRHTCAALVIAQGAHPKEIQEQLGHSTIRLTFDRYGHLFPGLSDRLRDGLEGAYQESLAASPRPEDENVEQLSERKGRKNTPGLREYLERAIGLEPATLTLAR